jgi:hypothetical protein
LSIKVLVSQSGERRASVGLEVRGVLKSDGVDQERPQERDDRDGRDGDAPGSVNVALIEKVHFSCFRRGPTLGRYLLAADAGVSVVVEVVAPAVVVVVEPPQALSQRLGEFIGAVN